MNDIELLINDMESFSNNPMEYIKDEINDIFSETLRIITQRTLYDTNSSREILLRIISEVFGGDTSGLLEDPIYWWTRKKQSTNYSDSVVKNNISIIHNIMIESDGLAGQEYNDTKQNYPTKNETLNSMRKGEFQPHHISFTCDQANAGNLIEIEKAIDNMINRIIDKLEGR